MLLAALAAGGPPALAQGVTGTSLGAAAPGRFAVGMDLGLEGVQFSRLRWGERFATGDPGDVVLGSVIDDRPTSGGIMPELSVGWGLPNGLLGFPAEVYGRFTFVRATASTSAFIDSTNISVAVANVFQFVTPINLTALGGSATQSGFNALAGGNPQVERTQTSYDGWIGARVHIARGRWTFSPMVEIGYQRLDQEDSMGIFQSSGFFAGASLSNLNQLSSDYYRVGIGLGVAYPLSTSIAVFGVLRGALDVAHHAYDGTTTGTNVLPTGSFFGSTSDSETRVSGRGSLRAGLAFIVTPAFVLSVAGNVAYIGSVPYVVYGSNSPIPAGSYANAAPARIATQGQLNYGASLGATIRF